MKNENVVCVALCDMQKSFDMTQQTWKADVEQINALPFTFRPRASAETDSTYKQLIPYAIVTDDDGRVLYYRRCGSEKRLSGICSAGIGGHVNDKDAGDSLYGILVNGMKREFLEEIGVMPDDSQISFVGMINEDLTEVGHVHTGVVFCVRVPAADMHFDAEIGTPMWAAVNQLNLDNFELWSALALRLVQD